MTGDTYQHLLREAGILKLRAMRLRALGDLDEQSQAAFVFHEAARKELAALGLLQSPSRAEDAGARTEACGLFLEARDPISAAEQWRHLQAHLLASDPGLPIHDHLKSEFHIQFAKFSKAWRAFKKRLPSDLSFQQADEKQLHKLVENYPGIAALWWALSLHTTDATIAARARSRMHELAFDPDETSSGGRWWEQIESVVPDPGPILLYMSMEPERRVATLALDAMSGIATAFSTLLEEFVKRTFGVQVELSPTSGSPGSFVLEVAAKNLPATAIDELNRELAAGAETVNPWRLIKLLHVLQEHRVTLVVSAEQRVQDTPSTRFVFDAARRKSMLEAAEAAALGTIDSADVPQADDLERVFRVVELVAQHQEVTEEELEVTPRQVAYYRRAAKALGLLGDFGGVTAAGRVIVGLSNEDRLRATVVHFESSACGEAWIRWSKGRTLLDVTPETALSFLQSSVVGLSADTVKRRAQTLTAWYKRLIGYHYARS